MLAILAQLASEPGETRANAERAARLVREHAAAAIAVFPELYLSGYTVSDVASVALEPDARELAIIAEAAAAASTAVVVGFPERVPRGVANAAAMIDERGTTVAVYRKTQLFGSERDAFVAGEEIVVASLAGRRAASLICFDIEFPELARQAALAGADLLVTCSANMEPFFGDHELATRSRALENRLPHLYANAVGEWDDVRFVGGSRSIRADGSVAAAADHAREETLVVPVGEPGTDDGRVDYLRHLPPRLRVAAT